jgi:hypothetical protein
MESIERNFVSPPASNIVVPLLKSNLSALKCPKITYYTVVPIE